MSAGHHTPAVSEALLATVPKCSADFSACLCPVVRLSGLCDEGLVAPISMRLRKVLTRAALGVR